MSKSSEENQNYAISENNFPIEVFNERQQLMIKSLIKCLNYPLDFISVSMLVAVANAIGKRSKVFIDYPVYVNMYAVIVSKRGTNKTSPVKWALQPYNNLDEENYKQSFSDSENKFIPHVVSDITIEELKHKLVEQQSGLLYYVDEFAGLVKNLNNHSKGDNLPYILGLFNNSAIRVNRRTSDSLFSKDSCLSIIGTSQLEVFESLIAKHIKSGFLDRILIVYKGDLKKPHRSGHKINKEFEVEWEKVIADILKTDYNDTYYLCDKAEEHYSNWHHSITEYCNQLDNEIITGIYTKLELYIQKFSLVIQLLDDYFLNKKSHQISLESIKKAEKLTNYFFKNAFHFHLKGERTYVFDLLNDTQKKVYKVLPKANFDKWQAENCIKENGIDFPKRTLERFLANKNLFTKVKHGKYRKKYE